MRSLAARLARLERIVADGVVRPATEAQAALLTEMGVSNADGTPAQSGVTYRVPQEVELEWRDRRAQRRQVAGTDIREAVAPAPPPQPTPAPPPFPAPPVLTREKLIARLAAALGRQPTADEIADYVGEPDRIGDDGITPDHTGGRTL